jgi:hypothetical protein
VAVAVAHTSTLVDREALEEELAAQPLALRLEQARPIPAVAVAVPATLLLGRAALDLFFLRCLRELRRLSVQE